MGSRTGWLPVALLLLAASALAPRVAAAAAGGGGEAEHAVQQHSERISGSAGDVLEDNPVGRLKVFIYDLPRKYNKKMVTKDPRCLNHMFAAEIFMHRFLLSSAVRTLNPKEADWFYTPVYTTCDLTNAGLPLPFKSPRVMRSAIQYISNKWSFWNRTDGADHFFVVPHDFAACFHYQEEKAIERGILPLLRRATLVQTFGQENHVCLKEGSIIIPPYAPPQKMQAHLISPDTPRSIFVYFRGLFYDTGNDPPSSGSGAGGAPVELEPGGGRGNLPRPNMKRPPPDSFDESRHPRQRAAADTDAPSSGGGAGRCRDLSRAFGRCRALLDRLLRDEDGWIFAAPVDARALRLRDYYTVIADPMDLGTVLRRLERRRYADPPAFAADVRLTFSNAKSYNNPGDPVYESADELSGIFEDGWASIQAELPPPPPTDAERKLKFRDDLKGLPVAAQRTVAGFLKERGACQLEKRGKLEVDLGKADAATLDELDRVVAKHRAADSDVVAPSPECRNHERGQTEGPSPKS